MKTMDTNLDPTEIEQVKALRAEAGSAGDREQAKICDLALEGDEDAIAECAEVLKAFRGKSTGTLKR